MQRVLALSLMLLCLLVGGSAMAGIIGTVVATSGSPTASGPEGSRSLAAGAEVYEHDKITVSSGNAQVELLDGTKLVVGSGSTLILERFLMKGGATAQSVSIDALRGTFRFITGRSAKSAYNIQTSNATIGIRGTAFDFWVADRTGVALLKGNVRVCSKAGGRSCVDLQPNCSVGVAGGGSPAHRIVGTERASEIGRKLPFIRNQSPLRGQFRLNTSSCGRELAIQGQSNPQQFQKLQQLPPPPDPPPPSDKCSTNCGNGRGNGGPGNGTGNEGKKKN
jgi:hypothetical protein